ncbi:glycosyltransferase [Sulfurimonas crateris]|uniref:Glycosyltransferase n=1 Tax=Sulfurimonas crateris TaxID=2574727 RepID=A0A4U2Z8Q4_9BACT|nr:glycosyltransferase [Sulfurimonas crateris]TKI69922.1 glycosyltransferase [Sulfurimonas crateris]
MSKIGKGLKLVKLIILNFGKLYSHITTHNIKSLIYHILKGNFGLINHNVMLLLNISHNNLKLDLIENCNFKEPLLFNECQSPKVSIVIPVYNQWQYTYKCLKSILLHTRDIEYEIIIADDVSADETVLINDIVKNIIVVRNEKNLGFLLNCNNAARKATGTHLLFLNNDTQVQEGWLSSLVELIERDEKIGMVGSKLVYPDGRLQEAGGIIWNDASGWNYGKFDDPTKPEYNYVKEVDYISGASIMIKKSLWDKIGGFDKRYVPAYYEDTDLAFEVRKHGYKVMYQPKSVAVHFEGISHGTDTNNGIKTYQVKNREKFIEKWKDELNNQFKHGENVFLTRDRSKDKKHMLVIDHYVPTYDKDAGSRATWNYMEFFVGCGYKVTFLGDSYHRNEPYTSMLESMGIEVLYGLEYRKNFEAWFKKNGKYFDEVILSRPHIAVKYIDIIKAHSSAKTIYYAHDLHFLREQRQYEITQDKKLIESSDSWKQIELELMSKTDETWLFSQYEKKILKEYDFKIKVVPLFLYKQFDQKSKNIAILDNNIMFIGGFSHVPNLDGMQWFIQNCWKEIKKKNSTVKLTIAGSNMPEQLKKLDGEDGIVVKGYLTDEELRLLYENSKVAVIPLRFGAGVKGKVVEALYNSTPIVTTTIGAEGLIEAQNYMKIADTKEEFVEAVLEMLKSETNEKYAKNSLEYCAQYFSYDYLDKVLKND